MKRYEPTIGHDKEGWPEPVMTDHPGGDFVKYDESAAIERQRDRAVELLRRGKRITLNVCDVIKFERDRDALLAEIDGTKHGGGK